MRSVAHLLAYKENSLYKQKKNVLLTATATAVTLNKYRLIHLKLNLK